MAHPALKEVYSTLKTRMDKAVEDFRREMSATRTGRANIHMLDTVTVDYYGEQMPLNQVSQIHAPEPQMITVQPFDTSQLGAIEKAIRGEYKGTGRTHLERRTTSSMPSFLFFIIFVAVLSIISRVMRRLGGYSFSSGRSGPVFIPMGFGGGGGGGWSSGGGGGFSGGGGLSGGGGASGSW